MSVRIPETGLKCKLAETAERQTFTYGLRLFHSYSNYNNILLLEDIGIDIGKN